MKLTRITKIRGHRVFRAFTWPNDLHSFGQFNVIYGWNGCGKTTLSSLLSLVEKRTALSEGELELEIDGSTTIAGSSLGSAPLPQVRVFNRDFINTTLQSVGGIAPIYYLGETSVEKQGQVEQLRNELESANVEVQKSTSEKTSADSKLDIFCIGKAKLIKEILTTASSTAYNNYDKRRFKDAAARLNSQAALAAMLTDDQKRNHRSLKDARPKTVIDNIAAPSFDLAALTKEVDDLGSRSVIAQTLTELTSNADLAAWIERGLALHSGANSSNSCRFCLQPLDTTRRAALEAHFNDALASFQRELLMLLSKVTAAQKGLEAIQLPDLARFYDHLSAEVHAAVAPLEAAKIAVGGTLKALIERVEAKRANPFASAVQAELEFIPNALTEAVAGFNAVVENHNRITEQFNNAVTEACKKLEEAYVAEAHAEYLQLLEAVNHASSSLAQVKSRPTAIQAAIDGLERQIQEHRRPAEELTADLRAYLGRDELQFEVKGNGYTLTRSGQPVSHLSEGERTAITFLYFLKSLKDKTFDLQNGIVVIDDPVSSLDANSLYSAFGYMKESTKKCGQLFIFTHSFPFFRLVKNWFHHLPKQRKKSNVDARPARFFLLRSCQHSDGSRSSQLGPLDPLLEEYESEYQYLFKRVYDEAHRTGVGSMEHHYGLPNVARRLLEAFLAFRFPDSSGDLSPRLDRVSFDNSKKTRILRLLNNYSHSGAIADPEHDLSLLAETQPVLIDVLELMKAVDREHYDGLARLVAVADGSV